MFGLPLCVRKNEDFVMSRLSNFGRAGEYSSFYRGLRYIEVTLYIKCNFYEIYLIP